MRLSKETWEYIHRVQGALMILEKKRLDLNEIICRSLANYYALIKVDAEVEFDKTFPNMFAELKNHHLLEKTK